MAAATQTAQVGSQFGLPGVSRSFEAFDNNDGLTFKQAAASQSTVTGIIPLMQTDVVFGWRFAFTIANTYTAGTTTLIQSEQFPWNHLGPFKLTYQNQFSPLDVQSGYDAAIFDMIRPETYGQGLIGTIMDDMNPPTTPYNAGTNLAGASNYTNASTSVVFTINAPAGLMFDRYFDRTETGALRSNIPMRTFVSPQLMAGVARTVSPRITMNQALLSSAAQAGATRTVPVIGSGTQTTAATVTIANATLNVDRYGYLQPTSQEGLPIVWPWQYTRVSTQISIAGQTTSTLLIPLNGQILSIWVLLYDPSSGSFGAPITVNATNITECSVKYASGLYKFQDDPLRMSRRFQRQHGFVLPKGLLCWDMALRNGLITNEDVLYTGDTSSIQVYLKFATAQSSTAYAIVGVEALTYVVM